MFTLFQSGGFFMYVILTVSIVALALFLERASYLYFRLNLNTEKSFKKVLLFIEKSNYRGALDECARIEKHPLGRILKAGLLKSDKRDKEIELAMEEKILREIPQLKVTDQYHYLRALLPIWK